MDSKKSNICVFCDHAGPPEDFCGVYCVGGFWKKDDGTCDHFKDYEEASSES